MGLVARCLLRRQRNADRRFRQRYRRRYGAARRTPHPFHEIPHLVDTGHADKRTDSNNLLAFSVLCLTKSPADAGLFLHQAILTDFEAISNSCCPKSTIKSFPFRISRIFRHIFLLCHLMLTFPSSWYIFIIVVY